MNNRSKNWVRLAWHPPDEELLAFLDGELSAKQAGKTRKHLESCWACRAKREEMERSISAFINYRHTALADVAEASSRAQMRFASKLNRLAAKQSEQPQLFHRYGALACQFFLFQPAVWATAVVFLVIGLGVWFSLNRRVSASELLQRAARAEADQLNRVSDSVAHRRFQVRRRPSVATPEQVVNWEIWNDSVNRRFAQRAIDKGGEQSAITQSSFSQALSAAEKRRAQRLAPALEVLLDLERIFQANQMDASHPVSAAAFQAWRQSIWRQREEVSETRLADGAEALTLTTAAATRASANGITEAALVVRMKDWRPIAQRLRVKAEGAEMEYEITELAFQVVSLGALDTTVFADRGALPPPPSSASSPASTMAPAAPTASPSSPVATAELEVDALERLNRANALLGEQLSLTRAPDGKLIIEGIVETDARKSEILEALKPVAGDPAVKIEVNTVAEASARQSQSASRQIIVQDARVAQQEILVDAELRNYLGDTRGLSGRRLEQEIQRFSAQICNRSSRARSHALAIKQIADRFTPTQLRSLDQATRQRFNALLVEHAQGYLRELEQLRLQLQPIFPAAASSRSAVESKISNDEDLVRAIDRLFESAASNDEALRQSFSVSTEKTPAAMAPTSGMASLSSTPAFPTRPHSTLTASA